MVEGVVDLRVGEVRVAEEGAYAAVEFIGTDLARFKSEKVAFLTVKAKKIIGIFHAEPFESIHTAVAVKIHDHTAEIKKQILYHRNIISLGKFTE